MGFKTTITMVPSGGGRESLVNRYRFRLSWPLIGVVIGVVFLNFKGAGSRKTFSGERTSVLDGGSSSPEHLHSQEGSKRARRGGYNYGYQPLSAQDGCKESSVLNERASGHLKLPGRFVLRSPLMQRTSSYPIWDPSLYDGVGDFYKPPSVRTDRQASDHILGGRRPRYEWGGVLAPQEEAMRLWDEHQIYPDASVAQMASEPKLAADNAAKVASNLGAQIAVEMDAGGLPILGVPVNDHHIVLDAAAVQTTPESNLVESNTAQVASNLGAQTAVKMDAEGFPVGQPHIGPDASVVKMAPESKLVEKSTATVASDLDAQSVVAMAVEGLPIMGVPVHFGDMGSASWGVWSWSAGIDKLGSMMWTFFDRLEKRIEEIGPTFYLHIDTPTYS